MKCAALLAVVLAFSGAPAAAMACALECRPEAAAAHADHHGGTAHGDSAAAASHQRAGHPAPPVQSRAVGAFHDCAHDPAVIRVTEPAPKASRAPIVLAHAGASATPAGAGRALLRAGWMAAPAGAAPRSPVISVLRI